MVSTETGITASGFVESQSNAGYALNEKLVVQDVKFERSFPANDARDRCQGARRVVNSYVDDPVSRELRTKIAATDCAAER